MKHYSNISRAVLSLLAAVVALSISACSGSGGDSPTNPQGLTPADVEFHSFTLINKSRAEFSRSALTLNQRLSDVARQHSEAMRDQGFFSHRDPSGQGLRARLNAAGISFSSAAENLAQVSDPQQPGLIAHHFLMDSPEHRANILGSGFTRVGVGVAQAGNNFWITQVFLRP